MKLTGENRQLGEKPVPVPLCPPQISHGLTRDFFFLPVRDFPPLIHFCTILYPFVLHVTFDVPYYRPYN
jgi:hypothetical protein